MSHRLWVLRPSSILKKSKLEIINAWYMHENPTGRVNSWILHKGLRMELWTLILLLFCKGEFSVGMGRHWHVSWRTFTHEMITALLPSKGIQSDQQVSPVSLRVKLLQLRATTWYNERAGKYPSILIAVTCLRYQFFKAFCYRLYFHHWTTMSPNEVTLNVTEDNTILQRAKHAGRELHLSIIGPNLFPIFFWHEDRGPFKRNRKKEQGHESREKMQRPGR